MVTKHLQTANGCILNVILSLSRIGGYPPPLLTENHPAEKPLAEMGGTPPPLTDKIQ